MDARDDPPGQEGIATLLSRAIAEGEQFVRAEIEVRQARLAAKVDEARNAVVFALGALILASLALIALVVGALLILAPRLGPITATVIVVGILVLMAALLGWMASKQVKLLFGKREGTP